MAAAAFLLAGCDPAEEWREASARSFDLFKEKKLAQAVEQAEKALDLAIRAFGGRHDNVVRAHVQLATILRAAGRQTESEMNLKKAIELSLSKYCPIANTLAGTVRISSSYRIESSS